MKSQLTGKDPEAGKDGGQEKGQTGGEMVGWYHRLNGPEFEQTPGESEAQRSLGSLTESGMTEPLNSNNRFTLSYGRNQCNIAKQLSSK